MATTSQVVASAWKAAELAFQNAALTADPDEPDLAATTSDPQLTVTRNLLAGWQASGDVATGQTRFGPVNVSVLGTGKASVVSCIYDAEIIVSRKTGQPLPGMLGEKLYARIESTMVLTSSGWKLATQTVNEQVTDPCEGA